MTAHPAGPPAPDPIYADEIACIYCGKRVSLECWSGEHHMARTRMDGAAIPAPPAGLTVERLAQMLRDCYNLPLIDTDDDIHVGAAAWLLPRLGPLLRGGSVSPGAPAAARRAPTEAMIEAAMDEESRWRAEKGVGGAGAVGPEHIERLLRAALAADEP